MKRLLLLLLFASSLLTLTVFTACDDNEEEVKTNPSIKVDTINDLQGIWQATDSKDSNLIYKYIFDGDNWKFEGRSIRSGLTWSHFGTYHLYERFVIFYYDESFNKPDEPTTVVWKDDKKKTLVIGKNEYSKIKELNDRN